MSLLHVICGFGPPPIKNPGYAYDSGSRFSTCFFQLLSATGSNRFFYVNLLQLIELMI